MPKKVLQVFVDVYPHPFKPYFDLLFSDWLKEGHEVRVVSLDRIDAPAPVDVLTVKTLRTGPALIARRLVLALLVSPRRCLRAFLSGGTLAERIKTLALDCQLPRGKPDVLFVQNLAAAVPFAYLKNVFPETPLALYYHGGELPGVKAISKQDSERALPKYDLVFSNTDYSIDEVVQRGARPETTRKIPVGFRLSDYKPRAHDQSDVLRLISVGRAAPEKGFDIALQAIANLKQRGLRLTYTLVGGGPELDHLQALANQLGLADCTTFAGKQPNTEVLARLAQADVMLLPSVPANTWLENQACVMQEAMLMGVPVIGSDIGGVRESVQPEMHEYLFQHGNVEQLAQRIERFAKLSGPEIQALREAGRAFVERNYDSTELNRRILDICFEHVVANGGVKTREKRPGTTTQTSSLIGGRHASE